MYYTKQVSYPLIRSKKVMILTIIFKKMRNITKKIMNTLKLQCIIYNKLKIIMKSILIIKMNLLILNVKMIKL